MASGCGFGCVGGLETQRRKSCGVTTGFFPAFGAASLTLMGSTFGAVPLGRMSPLGAGAMSMVASPPGTNRTNWHVGHLNLRPAVVSGMENVSRHDGQSIEIGMVPRTSQGSQG